MPQHTLTIKSPTGRVLLVPPNDSDDQSVSIIRAHPATRRSLRFLPETFSVEDARLRRESRCENATIVDFHVHALDNAGIPTFAGMTGIFNLDERGHACEIGILISPDYHGKGLATDVLYTLLLWVFEDKKVHRVTFETGEDNKGMRHWLENVAVAKLEAERRECWPDGDGKYSDVMGYSILEWEWKDRVKSALQKKLGI